MAATMDFNAWLLAAATEIVEAAEGEAYAAAKRRKRENKRFMDTVRAQLAGRVSLSCSLKQRYVPELRLRLENNWSREAQSATLLAFAQLAQYADRFDAHSTEKAAFYDLVRTKMMSTPLAALHNTQLIGKLGSPRFIVDIVERAWGASHEYCVNELVTVMTLPALSPENKALVRTFLCDSVQLRFKGCNLTANCLLLLQRGLDQVAAQPAMTRLSLSLLSLKNQKMSHEHFAVLTDIMKKNHEVYGIRELELANTLTRSEESLAFERLLSASFQPPMHSEPRRGSATTARALRRISLSRNALSCRHYAVICSALRYGCTIEELSLAGTMDGMGVSERQVCWRWLAFGLFYPRSRQLANRGVTSEFKLRRIDLSGLMCGQEDVDAFVKMLQDPVTGQTLTHSQLRICTIKPGSRIREAANETSPVILTFGDAHNVEDELEVFYEGDGWTCVVVPAFGLGWIITASRILKTELRYTKQGGSRPLYDLTMNTAKLWASCILPAQPFLSFIASIGSRIRSLDLSGTAFTSAHVPALAALATHCSRLQKLVLDKCGFDQPSSRELLGALGGDVIGPHLTSLSLNECIYEATDWRVVERICTFLKDATKLPRLKHLHLNSSVCTQQALSILYDALPAKKRLTVLELRVPPPSLPPLPRVARPPAGVREGGGAVSIPVYVTRQSFDAKFQNERVDLHLSRKRKIAFLSALKHYQETPLPSTNRFHVLGELDIVMARIIFQFATSEARRRILWS